MKCQSLDLNAISFVLLRHSASEPSMNFSNSKQAYYFLSCYGNVDITYFLGWLRETFVWFVCSKHLHTVSSSSFYFTIHKKKITAKEEKKNTELINANRKLSKNDNLKYNKMQMTKKMSKNTEKTILTRSVRQLRIQLNDWFTWTKNKTFVLNRSKTSKTNELTKIDNNGYVTRLRE